MLEAEQEEHGGVSKQQVTSLGGTARAWLLSSAGGITGAGNPMGRAELRHPSPALLGAPGAGMGCKHTESCPKEGGSRTAGTCWLWGHARLNIFTLGRNIFPLETPAWVPQRCHGAGLPRARAAGARACPGQPVGTLGAVGWRVWVSGTEGDSRLSQGHASQQPALTGSAVLRGAGWGAGGKGEAGGG